MNVDGDKRRMRRQVEVEFLLVMVSARKTVLKMRVLATLMTKIVLRLGHTTRLVVRSVLIWTT